MIVQSSLVVVFATLFLACGPIRVKDSSYSEHFVVVNGVRLHHVDWGGNGASLLFLTPLGGDLLEQFGSLAPQFTDRFRVLGLTRRGQGQSDKPNGDYDTDTLVRDIVAFLDEMGIARAHVAGQSVAGAEMTRLATEYPSRVTKLVYLDAAVDYHASAELAKEAGMGPPDDPALAAILQGAGVRSPEYARVRAPALNIAVVFDGPIPVRPEDDEAYKRFVKLAEERDVVGSQIRQFERGMAGGETLILRNTTHGGFVAERRQQEVFVPVMREFLLRPVFATTLARGSQGQLLSTIDVPAKVLPADCGLVPSPSRMLDNGSTASGLWGGLAIPKNPSTTVDRTQIARIYVRMFGPLTSPDGPPMNPRQSNEFALRSTEHVDEGYAAFYARGNSLSSTHVYGVRFKDRTETVASLRKKQARNVFIFGDTVVRVHPDEDGCGDAILEYFSALSSK